MFGDRKRFRASPVFDEASYQTPPLLKKSLELIAESFNSTTMRSLHLMDTNDNQRLFGFITTYVSANFCWIQPTRTLNRVSEVEYHKYLKKINTDAVNHRLEPLIDFKIGANCIAQYEADNKWYRAIIVDELHGIKNNDKKWQVIFIDYGNFQYCSKSQIAGIIQDKEFDHFHAPMQAVCCRLYNIVPKLPQNRPQIDSKLEEFYSKYSETFLEIIVRNKRCDYIVDCDVFLCRSGTLGERRFFHKHIGQKLVDSGIAYFANPAAAYATLHNRPESPPIETVTLDDDNEEEDLKRKIRIKREVKIKVDSKAFCNFIPDCDVKKESIKREFKVDDDNNYETPPSTQTPIKIKVEPMP